MTWLPGRLFLRPQPLEVVFPHARRKAVSSVCPATRCSPVTPAFGGRGSPHWSRGTPPQLCEWNSAQLKKEVMCYSACLLAEGWAGGASPSLHFSAYLLIFSHRTLPHPSKDLAAPRPGLPWHPGRESLLETVQLSDVSQDERVDVRWGIPTSIIFLGWIWGPIEETLQFPSLSYPINVTQTLVRAGVKLHFRGCFSTCPYSYDRQ